MPAWNADQNLRSAMRHSALWVYERFARELGEKRETDYLRKAGYGNALATGKAPFWGDGDTPNRDADLPKRQAVVERALQDIDVFPPTRKTAK